MRTEKKSGKRFVSGLVAAIIIVGSAGAVFSPLPVSAATGGTDASASLDANAGTATALDELKVQTAVVATSPELQQASTSLWSLAWQKSSSFLRDVTFKFFGLFRIAWDSLVHAFKGAPATDADVNASVGANAPPERILPSQ